MSTPTVWTWKERRSISLNCSGKLVEFGNRSGEEFWVYFTSPHPEDMNREVLEVIASYANLAKQIHLPMQSGDERVLIKMNRRHSMDKYRRIVADIRELLPQATCLQTLS